MKILECDKIDCPANSKYTSPEPLSPSPTGQGMYHNNSGILTGAGAGGNTGVLDGMLTINGMPSYITGPYYTTSIAVPAEPSIYFCWGDIKVHPACLACIHLPKVDMKS